MPYPDQRDLVRALILNDHTELKDTPLALAIYFKSRQWPNEECVFEVLHRFGLDEVSEVRSVFQIQFGATQNFPLPDGDRLHLFLSNPIEMMYAIEHGWPEIHDLVRAIQAGSYEVIYGCPDDPSADQVLAALKGFANALSLAAVA